MCERLRKTADGFICHRIVFSGEFASVRTADDFWQLGDGVLPMSQNDRAISDFARVTTSRPQIPLDAALNIDTDTAA